MVLKPWHWSVAPNLRRHLILKFIALVFKEAELPTSNIEHVRKIAAYAASIEVKVFQSTESQNDYNREITKEYSVALAKLKMRKQLRMQQEAASLRTDTTDNVQSQSVGRGTVQQSMGNASSESTSNSYVIPTQTFPVTTYNNVSNSNEYEPEVLYEAPHPQQQIHNRTAEPPPYHLARQQQQQQQKSIDQSSSNYRQQPMSCRVPQPVSQPPNSCSVLQQILERPTSDQYSVNDPHNSQHINKTVTTSNEPTFFSQQQTVPDTYNTHGIFGSFSDGKSVMEEQQQQVGSCSVKLESETDFMQKCNICLKVNQASMYSTFSINIICNALFSGVRETKAVRAAYDYPRSVPMETLRPLQFCNIFSIYSKHYHDLHKKNIFFFRRPRVPPT